MSNKKIDTLVEDIYDVFLKSHTINEENLKEFGENVKGVLRKNIKAASEKRNPYLRLSIIGKPDRQLWYELKTQDIAKVAEAGDVDVFEPNPEKYIKFLFGDIIEQLLIFLIKESGHTLSHVQEELKIDDVLGHCDVVIDGVPVDIKTASKYAFTQKFKFGGLLRGDDPFGYVGQLSAYREKLTELYPEEIDSERVAWLAMNKETGELCLLLADSLDLINAEDRIKHIKKFLEKDTPPEEKCYQDEPEGENGNRILSKTCVYCPFKQECWKNSNDGRGLRTFKYSNGDKYFTHIVKIPRVEEKINA